MWSDKVSFRRWPRHVGCLPSAGDSSNVSERKTNSSIEWTLHPSCLAPIQMMLDAASGKVFKRRIYPTHFPKYRCNSSSLRNAMLRIVQTGGDQMKPLQEWDEAFLDRHFVQGKIQESNALDYKDSRGQAESRALGAVQRHVRLRKRGRRHDYLRNHINTSRPESIKALISPPSPKSTSRTFSQATFARRLKIWKSRLYRYRVKARTA
jgi:hypothetical protein